MQKNENQLELIELHSQRLQFIGSMVGRIAHEINNPIQYVGDNLNFIEKTFFDVVEVLQSYEKLVFSIEKNGASNPTETQELMRDCLEIDVKSFGVCQTRSS